MSTTGVTRTDLKSVCECGGRGLIKRAGGVFDCQWCGRTRFVRVRNRLEVAAPRVVS